MAQRLAIEPTQHDPAIKVSASSDTWIGRHAQSSISGDDIRWDAILGSEVAGDFKPKPSLQAISSIWRTTRRLARLRRHLTRRGSASEACVKIGQNDEEDRVRDGERDYPEHRQEP